MLPARLWCILAPDDHLHPLGVLDGLPNASPPPAKQNGQARIRQQARGRAPSRHARRVRMSGASPGPGHVHQAPVRGEVTGREAVVQKLKGAPPADVAGCSWANRSGSTPSRAKNYSRRVSRVGHVVRVICWPNDWSVGNSSTATSPSSRQQLAASWHDCGGQPL